MEIEELKERQRDIIEAQQRMMDIAEVESRDFTTEEEAEWRKLDRDFEKLVGKIEALEESRTDNYLPVSCRVDGKYHSDGTFTPSTEIRNNMGVEKMAEIDNYIYNPSGTEIRDVWNKYLVHGSHGLTSREYRALQADLDVSGGFLVTPTVVANGVLHDLDNMVFVRERATKIKLDRAESLRIPNMAHDFGDPTWTSELGTGSEDTDLDFAGRDLHPNPIARRLKVSNKLLRIAKTNPEIFVRKRMLQVLSQVLESNYLNGTGVNSPLGLLVESSNGISSSRDTTCASATTFTIDEIITLIGTVKEQFRKDACFIVSRSFETALRKKKTGEGAYIYTGAVSTSAPATLYGYPVHVSEYMPTYSSGNYIALFGNLEFYYVVDSLQMQIKRLDELYAETDQTGFIIRYEGDAAPVMENAFARLQLA